MNERDHDDPELRGLLASLRTDPDDGFPDDDGFSSALHRRLVQAGPPAAPGLLEKARAFIGGRPLMVGLFAGACAGAVVFFALRLALPMPALQERATATVPAITPAGARAGAPAVSLAPAIETSAEVFVVPAGKVAMVQLHFAVEHAVDEAEFSVLLPAELAFFSDGEALAERSFHWVAPLREGDNHVPIAIVGQAPGKHRVTATATIAGEVVVHEVVLDVQEPT